MTQAQNTIRYVKSEASSPKSRLMDLLRTLEKTPGCAREARRLSGIIGRLEAWQNG